ncbi:hypothetical protein DFH07DRAFT_425683 [Mycena maculata]|uniref:Uncharacterized protein n=1 Tax=Mycena maculata TaxID=230809 RepID=A0AAD7JD61_9AGAR|nr:hypothetical protein DFH07DRAFT_425683 [Mycena maculata]
MFHQLTVLLVAAVVSSVVGVPLPQTGVPTGCNADLVTSNIAQMQQLASQISGVGAVLPDPFNRDPATFNSVVSALSAASTAAAAGDFATTATQVGVVASTTDALLDGLVSDGLESSLDLSLGELADDTSSAVAACV